MEVFYQTSSVSTSVVSIAARQSVAASFIHADVGYSIPGPWRPRLSVEYDRASGGKRGGKFGRFDTLYGMRRAELAPAGLYNALTRTNIETTGVRIEATPSNRLDWFAAYRPMWLAAREDSFSSTGVRDAAGRSGRFAGHQVEARLRYWLVPSRVRFEFDGLVQAKRPRRSVDPLWVVQSNGDLLGWTAVHDQMDGSSISVNSAPLSRTRIRLLGQVPSMRLASRIINLSIRTNG